MKQSLPEELRVRDGWTAERETAAWRRLVQAQQQQESARTAGVVLGFFCLAAFTAIGIFGLVRSRTAVIALSGDEAPDDSPSGRGPERFAPGAVPLAGDASAADPAAQDTTSGNSPRPDGTAGMDDAPVRAAGRRLRFRDGSVAILRSTETVLEPVSVESHRIVNVLRTGAARFEITKRPDRVFRVIAGDAIVEVLGTKFELERMGARLHVAVTEGRVRVSWPGGERRLGRGESGLFPPEPPLGGHAAGASRGEVAAGDFEPDAPTAQADAPGSVPKAPNVGGTPAPGAALTTAPRDSTSASPGEPPASEDELAELLRAADRARAAGRALDAAAALRAAIARAPSDSRVPLAQFRLGRLLLEDLGKPGQAAAAFAKARALAPDGPLAPDALAREIESRAAAGDRARARALARVYLTQYPNGSHAAWVRRWGAPE